MNSNMPGNRWIVALFAMVVASAVAVAKDADPSGPTVKITPIGQRTGEYCARDRALIFEDPTGVRILYDPGVTVAGGSDVRLGAVDAILVSHSHFDHIGYQKLTQNPDAPAATCGDHPLTSKTSNTTTAEIAAAKNSAVLVNGNMAQFLSRKIELIRGVPTPPCPPLHVEGEGPDETVVPMTSPCAAGLAFGSTRIVTRAAGAPGVRVNIVAALHSDSLFNPKLLYTSTLGTEMDQDLLTGYDGLANGFVLTFTNGLTVYLTGDTGVTSEMIIVQELYHPNLAVANMDGTNNMGPEEAAFAMTKLVRPLAVIPSHAEQPATINGQLIAGTRTAKFVSLLRNVVAYLPLSGRTMEFDSDGRCVSGCEQNHAGKTP